MIRAALEPATWLRRREAGQGRAIAGPSLDEGAFRALHERTARSLRAYLRRLVGNADLADDLLQETYLRLLRLPRERVEAVAEESRGAYLYRIASRLAQDHWRRVKRAGREEELDPETAAPAEGAGRSLDRPDLARAFAELSGRDRALLWLAHVEERDHKEIAGILGLASASVRVLLFRARRRFGRLLAERGLAPGGPNHAAHPRTTVG